MRNRNSTEKKQLNKARIAKFILQSKETSKPEIASSLGISMPTVLQNIKELMTDGIIQEVGEYESTGGRKAKALSVVADRKYAVGVDVTGNHLSYVLIDLKGSIVYKKRIRIKYENTLEYYEKLNQYLEALITDAKVEARKILGVGISLPGIVDQKNQILLQSHILQVSNVNLRSISQMISYDTVFENDANSAAMAELNHMNTDAVYLSLSNSVGGAIYMDNQIYRGDGFRSAEFGHMIIEANGTDCYCGKKGCVDAYCSALVLAKHADDDLEAFFSRLDRDEDTIVEIWNQYLEYLAITITNLRMCFNCDIILGGYVGGYMQNRMADLSHYVLPHNKFENDTLYVKGCKYTREASAVGIAMSFLEKYFDSMN